MTMSETAACSECDETDFDYLVGCVEGFLYGPCGDENCAGWCDGYGECDCRCHSKESSGKDVEAAAYYERYCVSEDGA